MKQIKYVIFALGLLVGFGLIVVPTITVAATGPVQASCTGTAANTDLCKNLRNNPDQLPTIAKDITNTLLYVLAAVSVIVIIVAGIMYTTSSGDAALITKAKNTLLYAVVGLVVAIMAYAIVNYVITSFGG